MLILERWFELRARNTTVARELRGAVATFLTMAYILFANPLILGQAAGMTPEHQRSLLAATALAAGACSMLMGLVANFPLALASGMGLNAFVAFEVTRATGSWQAAMGLVVLDGAVTFFLVLVGLREAVMHAIPRDLRLAIAAGIGLFIAFIGLVNARLVVVPVATLIGLNHDPAQALPPVGAGTLASRHALVALIGLILTAVLVARRVTGALVVGILATTLVGYFFGITRLPQAWDRPRFDVLFEADAQAALAWRFVPLLFALVMVDFFDTLGTAGAVAEEARLVDERGRIPRLRRVLFIDSASASIGGMLGASSVTSYVESAAGVAEGARTGLHSVFVGLMFLASIVLAPVAGVVPAAATAPALVLVGFLMMAQVARIDFAAPDTAIPAFVTLLTIPLTFSIAHGIGYGFVAFVAIKLLSGRWRDAHPLMYLAAAAFAVNFYLEARSKI
jgi:AGZA family xanthine/uracil permease-like MFS transporter